MSTGGGKGRATTGDSIHSGGGGRKQSSSSVQVECSSGDETLSSPPKFGGLAQLLSESMLAA